MKLLASVLTAAALCGLAPAALAAPIETGRVHYVEETTGYTVHGRRSAAGTLYLTGAHPETGATFDLRVSRSGHVTGEFAGQPVDYMVGDMPQRQQLAAR